jgi:la-related protein 4
VNNSNPTHSAIDPSSPLWKDLQRQLEYYFSPQNLGNDKFLREHMDAEGFVPISLIAGFNKVISLTTDLQLVTEVLRDSKTVQVDETGEKVRSLVNSGMLILREIPENTPVEEVRQLFNSDRCPPLISCHFMHNDNWLARFESHDDATRAYTYLRESRLLFRGQPIHARLKNPHGTHGLKSPDGVTSPTTPPARQIQPQYPTAPVPPSQQSTGVVQTVQPPPYQSPASQPVAQQQAVYQQAANTSARVYTPQPAPQQVPPQMVSQTVAGNMVGPGPQTIQSVPPQPPAGIPTHQLPPGAAVQLIQPQPNYTVLPSNAPWPEQYAFYNPMTGQIMQ